MDAGAPPRFNELLTVQHPHLPRREPDTAWAAVRLFVAGKQLAQQVEAPPLPPDGAQHPEIGVDGRVQHGHRREEVRRRRLHGRPRPHGRPHGRPPGPVGAAAATRAGDRKGYEGRAAKVGGTHGIRHSCQRPARARSARGGASVAAKGQRVRARGARQPKCNSPVSSRPRPCL